MTSRESQLAGTLVQLADSLVADFDVVELLSLLVDRCVDLLGAAAAGLMLAAPDGELRVMASSSEAMRILELLEIQASQGPCFDCFSSGRAVSHQNLADAAARWPLFAPEAERAGFHAVQALPLRLRGTVIGALNLFHTGPEAMDPADVEAAQAFADVATIAILHHQATLDAQTLSQQLSHALNSRIVIEQAKGMAAERLGIGVEEAFGVLRRYARNRNARLADVAAAVIDGTLAPSILNSPA